MTTRPLPVRKPPGLRGVLAVLVAVGSALPATSAAQDAAQDTVTPPGRGWIGIRFTETPPWVPASQWSFQLLVADVNRNGPADQVGIVPGDWFVSVHGNPISTYETWLRSTSNLGAGQPLRLRIVRSGDEHEVTVVAGLAPAFIGRNPLDQIQGALARFDSVFAALLDFSPAAEPWPWHNLAHIAFRGEFGVDSGTLTVTFDGVASTSTMGAEVSGPRPEQTGGVGELPRSDSQTGAERESPPSVGGGGTELTIEVYTVDDGRPSVLVPQLLDSTSTVLFGGVWVRDLTAELGLYYFGVETGVLVTDVIAMSPGSQAGFRPGDVIVSVEGQTFESVNDFRRLLAAFSTPIELTVTRHKNSVKIIYPRPER